MASKRQEFYMSVKAILDKTQAKKDAAELQELLSQTKIDFDTPEFESKVRAVVQKMSKETMSVIGQSFNEALKLLGKEQINIDSLIQMPNADMWTEMGKMAGRFYGEGLQEAVKKALEGIDLSALNGQKKTHGWIKNLGEIDQALSRLKDKKGNISQTKAKKIQEGFSPKPRKQEEALYTQIEKLQKSYSDKDEWEVRYANLVEYIKLYESYQEKFKNVPKELASIGKFTYKQVKSIEPQLQTSLQNIFNVAAGKQPIGLTEGGTVDVNVIPRVIETLDMYDILGGKDKIKVPVEVKVENEPKKSRMTPNALRGVQSPEETAGNRLSSREYLGGTYWVPNAFKDIAKNYGDGGNVLKAALKPLNELIVSVDGLEFKDLDKNQLLSYLFPGFDKYEQGGQQGDAPQKFFNEMARQAGFDSFVIKEVNEGGNELVDTIAVLQERITHYTEAIPEYYDVEKLTPDQERVVLSQQKGSAERWYGETINRLHQERDVAYANRDDIKEEKKVKIIDSVIPMLEQMKAKAMVAFDQAIQPLGGYLEEEVKRGLPEVIKDVDGGRKVALIQEDTLKSYLSEYSELSSKKTRTKAENARINDINNAITSVVSENDIDNVYDYLDALSEGAKTIDEVFDFLAPKISFKPNNFVNSVIEPNISGTEQPSNDNNVNKTIQSYEELCDVVKRYNELVLKNKTEGQTFTDTDREELDGLTNRIQATRDLTASDDIINEINAFDQTLSALGTTTPEKLAHYLGIEIPESARKAQDSIEAVNDSVNELDKQQSNGSQSTSGAEPQTSTSDTTTAGKVAIDETALKSILDSITYKVQIVGDNESSEQGTTVISEESLKTILSSVTFNVQGSSEASTEEANKVAIDETSLENVLNKVFGNILTSHDASTKGDNAGAPQAQSTEKVDESSPQAPWARESTLSGEIKSTLEDIRKNTTLDENNKPETSLGEDTVTRLTDAISQINITSDLTTEGLATQDTVSEISGLVKSINDKIVQGTKVIEKGKSTSVGDSKNTQKHNSTINHGQAEGTSGSAQKMFDYYYWLEEQMEKFKNNTKYYNALKSVRDRITPKIVKFNDELEISGKESPVWKKSLDQKHDLHMAQIQGGEEYSDSLSTEKKALELLKEEYRLKSEIFNLEQQGAIKEDLDPLYEKLGIYQSIRNIIEDGMDDGALTRYAVQAASVQGKGEDKLTVANIKSNIKARAEEVKQAAQSVKEEEQQEATALKELKKLYSELGVLQAKKQASDKGSAVATELRAQISAKKSEIVAKQVDHNINQQLLEDERQLSYEKEKSSIAMQNAASKDATATKEDATALKELKKLYETLGKQKAIMDAATPGAQYDKAKSDYDKIVADIQNIPKASNFEAEDEIDIYNKAYEEQKRVLENEKKIQDEKQKTNDTLKQTKQSLEEIKKLYAELGKWQAILDTSYDDSYVAQDAQLNIDRLKEEIAAKKEKVDISEEELQQIYQIAKAEKQRAIASQQSKQGDKSALKQQIKQSRENARFNRASSVWNAGVSTMESLWKIDDDSIDISQINVVRQLNDALNALKVTRDKVAQQGSAINPNDEALLKAQTQDVARLSAQVKELIQNYEQLSGENSIEIGKLGTGDLRDQLIAAVQEFTHGKAVIGDFDATTGRLEYTVKTGAHEFTKYTAAVRDADGSLRAMQGTTKRTETFFEASARKMKEISSYVTGMGLISRGMQEIRQGITYVREIDSALTELKKVTDETEESYDRFLQTASKTAAKVGSTVKDVVSSTADFARLGYSMQEAATMAENAQLLMNVSEFDDISKATDTLISAMQAFNYSADETLHVVDVFNTIGNNYAISTADLADSLTRSSAALVAAGNSLEQASALTVAGNTILQDPESVGNALKVVSMRIRGVSSDLEKAGEETDGMITNTAKLQAKIQGLTGVNILQDNGAFKDTYTILYELGKAYENLDDLSRASLLELIAGKTRGSAVAAILQNYELLEEAYNDALDAEGSAWKENQKYLDSIQGKIDQFTNAVQTMWSHTLDDSWIKGFVSFGTIIIQTIDKIGLLTTALIALGAVSMIKNKTGPIVFLQDLTKFATDANTKIANFPKTINTLVQGTQRLTSATLEQAVANGSLTTSEAIRQATMSGLVLSQVSLTAEEAKALLATTALNEVEQQNIITKLGLSSSSQKVTLAMLQQAVATGKLTASEATQMALATGLVAKETALTAARATKILTTNGVAASEAQAIVSALGLGKATQTLTLATIQQAIANGTLTASQGAVAMSLLATQGAATGLIGTLTALLAAIWPLLAIGVAIFAIVKIIDAVVTTTKELEEELSGLKSELSDIQSELDSVNNELKTTKERMDELLSKGTLSFTEEEELKKLKKANGELEREIYLLEQREKRKNKEVAQKFVETMDSAHGGTLFRDAVILEHSMPAWASTTEKINKKKDELKNASTEKRKFLFLELDSEADKIQKEIDNLEKERDAYAKSTDDTIDKYLEYAEGVEYFEGDNLEEWQKASNEQLDFINNMRDKWEIMLGSTNAKPNAISRIFNKEQFSEISDEIDKLVEKLKEDPGNTVYEEKIRDIICSNEELQNNLKQTGLTVDDAVASFTKFSSGFDSDSIDGITEQYQNAIDVLRRITIDRLEIEKELKQYAYGGTVDLLNRPLVDASELSKVGWENAGEGTATVFSSTYSNETGTIAVNFTPILPDGSRVLGPDELQRYAEDVISGVRRDDLNLQIGATFEGEDAIDQAVNAAEKIHNLQDMYYLPIKVELDDGTTEEIKWDDLFEWDEASKQWKAQSTQFAKILKDTDETLRQEFITLAENIKNNKISIEDAVNSLELSGLIRITKLTENTLSTLNTDMFADVKDDISGLIDTFSELGSALESTASAMDLLHSAQQQMNNSGRISVKTALELIESTDNWEKILTVTGNTITLNSDAEQVLIGTKLQLIEKNIDLALSQAQLQLAQIEGTEATLENAEADLITVEAQKTYDNAMLQSSAVSAGLGAAVGVLVQKLNALRNLDFDNSALNTSLFDAFNSAYDSVITLSTSTVDASVTADELKQKISALQAQKNLISQVNTSGNFKDYYDFDETPGDKYTDKSSTKSDSALEKLKKEYENKISLLENQKTYIENEISRLEASDQQVSRNLYEEQIKLEQQKLALYEKERKKLLTQMSTVAKNSDEWYEYADAIWEVEHSIQETAISVVELQKKIAQLYIDVFNKIDEAYSKEQSLHDKRIEALEDEIELLKLRNEYATISPKTYNQLSAEEDAKIQSNQNEITRLKALLQKGIDENGEALTEEDIYDMLETIYEKEADIRQSEIKKEQYKQDKKQAYLDRFNNTSEAYDNLANVYQGNYDNAEYYKKYADLYGISIPKEILDYQTSQLEQQVQVTLNKKAELERQLAEAIASGDIQVGDSQWLEMVNAINDCTSAANEFQYQIAEVAQEINALSVEKFNDIKDAFSNVNDVFSDRQSYIEEYMNYLEALGITVPAEMYEELIANEEQRQASNMASLESLRSQLAEMEANGYTAEDDEWVQAQADIRALEKEVLASETAMAQWNKTIQEMSFEKFDEFLKRIRDVCDELENVYGLISGEDVALEDGSWTEEGIMSLGLMTQKMAIAKEQAAEYAKEIEKLEEEYQKGTMSEQDYYNRLMELKDGQWESINAYKDAKDAIIDINEARIDMIEQGIQKEIDAYTKLIDLKKKELDAERDLYNFRKDIKSQTKDIATLERKIAAMSGSTDAATIAQRSKLEAQLREARESLNDTYYDHAMDSQSNAYDDELDSYTKSKEDYVKQLREALKDVEKIVADSMAQVLVNADSVLTGLNNVSSEYGVTLSDYLMLPWQNAALQATAYKESGILDLADFTDQTGIYSGIITEQINNLFGNGSLAAGLFQTSVEGVVESVRVTVNEATSPLTSDLQLPWQTVKEYAQNTFAPEIMYALQSVADDAFGKKEQLTNDLIIAFQEGVNNAEEFNQVVIDALNDVINKSDDFADVVPSNVTAPSDDPWSLWSSNVQNLIQKIIDKANDAVTAINSMNNAANNAQSIADTINSTGTSDNGGKGNSGSTKTSQPTSSYPPIGSQHTKYTEADVKALQSVLNSLFSTGLTVDGKLGPATSAAIKKAQRIMYQNGNETMKVQDGLYGVATRAAMISYIDKKIDNLRGQSGSSMMNQGIKRYTDMKKTLPKAFYAKGTMGISKDQWAITDEPQFGDELVLIPGASGNLSFMRKGTSVVPADITKRIFDLAQTPTNELGNNLVKVSIPNVSTNNNIELTFDTLLKVENATKETIPELKKLVQEQLDVFARKLNYGIKRVGQ